MPLQDEPEEQAGGILLWSPTYVTDVSSEIKDRIVRTCLVARAKGGMCRRKVGAAAAAVRCAGDIHAYDTLNHFFLINELIVPRSSFWKITIGNQPELGEHGRIYCRMVPQTSPSTTLPSPRI